MKKSIIAAGIVLALGSGWTIAEWQTGKTIESNKEAYTVKANEQIALMLNLLASQDPNLAHMMPKLNLTLESYDRGVLSSTARYALSEASSKNNDEKIHFIAKIEHGPFPASELGSFHLSPKVAVVNVEMEKTPLTKPLFDVTNDKSPFLLKIIPGAGESRAELSITPIKYEGLILEGTKFQATTNKDLSVLQSTGKIGTFSFDAPEGTLKVDSVSFDVDMKQGQFANYVGNQNMKIKSVAFQVKQNRSSQVIPLIKVENISSKNEMKEDNANLQIAQLIEFGTIKIGDNDLGTIKLGGSVSNVNGPAFKKVMDLISAMPNNNFDFDSEAKKQLFAENVEAIFSDGPVIKLAPISWTNKAGVSSYSATVELNKISIAELEDLPDEQMISKVIKNADSDLSISIPMIKSLAVSAISGLGLASAEDAEKQIDQSISQLPFLIQATDKKGFLTLNNDKIESKINLNNGIATLNGKQMPFMEFVRLMQDEENS